MELPIRISTYCDGRKIFAPVSPPPLQLFLPGDVVCLLPPGFPCSTPHPRLRPALARSRLETSTFAGLLFHETRLPFGSKFLGGMWVHFGFEIQVWGFGPFDIVQFCVLLVLRVFFVRRISLHVLLVWYDICVDVSNSYPWWVRSPSRELALLYYQLLTLH
jgi:hypothetical protein